METAQIYGIVNSLNSQAFGETAVTVTDTGSFVSIGDSIISSSTNTEPWLNALGQMIYTDIVEGRAYRSPYAKFIKGSIEWGSIIRKLSVEMPDASAEQSIPLVNGTSVDQWVINNPEVTQNLFVTRTPYKFWVTIQRHWLVEAFRSASDMEAFIASIFMKVGNKMEVSIENLTKGAMNNMAGTVSELQPNQVINLVSIYNALATKTLATGPAAMFDADFLRWSTGFIRQLARNLTNMSVLYNVRGKERFTPFENQNLVLLNNYVTQLETVALYSAFSQDELRLVDNTVVPYWQGSGITNATGLNDFASTSTINVTTNSGTNHEIENVIGMMFDDNALGAYRKREAVATTDLNANGLYYNTFWHENQMYFNALDENYLLLTLN